MDKPGSASQFFVLCVDDEPEILEILENIVSELGFTPLLAPCGQEAIELLEQNHLRIALILSDFKMPDITGLELRTKTLAQFKHIPFVIFSGNISREEVMKAVELKISAFAEKPLNLEAMSSLIRKHAGERAQFLHDEDELIVGFVADVENLVEEMEAHLLFLQTNPADSPTLDRIFAIAHTIKGSSGFFSYKTLHKFTHAFEDFLSPFRKSGLPVPAQAVSVLLKGLDTIKSLLPVLQSRQNDPVPLGELLKVFQVSAVQSSVDETRPAAGPKSAPNTAQKDEIKVPMKVLDEFMELSSEITVIRNMINKLVHNIEREIHGNRDVSLLSELLNEMHKINGQMQEKVVDLRKVSCKNIFRPLNRTVRDLSSELKKEVRFETHGEDIRVDTAIAEVLSKSLIHMVRNSMDHGIEDAGTRASAGKGKAGNLSIEAVEENQEVVVTIRDDGKGIDPELIRKKAVEKGLFDAATAAKMSTRDIQAVIFAPGFSTAAQVTDVSGRGVGMDMVQKTVTGNGGKIEIDSTPGKGSTFRLVIPVPKTVTIINSLLVKCAALTLALPQENLLRLLAVTAEHLESYLRPVQGADFLFLENQLLPILNLESTLNGKRDAFFRVPRDRQCLNLALVQCEAGQFALFIDEILDAEDTVVKKMGRHLESIPIYKGATFFGDGRVGLILDVAGCARFTSVIQAGAQAQKRADAAGRADTVAHAGEPTRDLLLLGLRQPGTFGIFLDDVFRLEDFPLHNTQVSGTQRVVIYRGVTCPLIAAESLLGYSGAGAEAVLEPEPQSLPTLILAVNNHYIGICVRSLIDLVQSSGTADAALSDRPGIAGALLHGDRTVTILDASGLLSVAGTKGIHLGVEEKSPHTQDKKAPVSEEEVRHAG